MCSLLLLTLTMSGCLSASSGSASAEDSEVPAAGDEQPPFFTDGDYTCIEHEERDRCWITHVPENLDPEADRPAHR